MDYSAMPDTPEPRQDDFGSLLSMLRYAREEAARNRLDLETYFLDMASMSLSGRVPRKQEVQA